MKLSLQSRIFFYLKARPHSKINGGEIERLALEAGYKASNASRRARELAERGAIQRKIIGKTVWYWYVSAPLPKRLQERNLTMV